MAAATEDIVDTNRATFFQTGMGRNFMLGIGIAVVLAVVQPGRPLLLLLLLPWSVPGVVVRLLMQTDESRSLPPAKKRGANGHGLCGCSTTLKGRIRAGFQGLLRLKLALEAGIVTA